MTFQLSNGNMIPLIGFGTFQIRSQDIVYEALDSAICSGYRLIDTASCYRNEKDIGEALQCLYKKHNLSRKDLFITSKLVSNPVFFFTRHKHHLISMAQWNADIFLHAGIRVAWLQKPKGTKFVKDCCVTKNVLLLTCGYGKVIVYYILTSKVTVDLKSGNLQQKVQVIKGFKTSPNKMGYESALATCKQTLTDLQTDYIDLYLIHWPGRAKLKPEDKQHSHFRKETWRAFQEMYANGCIKNIGVSNFTITHLEELFTFAEVPPVLNQVEFHPHLYQIELLKYCQEKHVFLQAYSSLGSGKLIGNETIEDMAKQKRLTPSQILLAWALHKNIGVLPKSTNPVHISENFEAQYVELSVEEKEKLDSLNQNIHYCWDPTVIW